MKDIKIIIPGGAGLVGQNLIVHLKQCGYRNIVVLDKHQANLNVLEKLHPEITVLCVDLAEKGEWEKQFEGADTVVMLQAQIGARDELPFIRNNLTTTENILSAIKHYQVPYTVHVSSSVVESVANDFYSQTKKAQEKQVLESGINCVVLRPTLMFGWFDRKHLGWLSRFMQKIPVFPIPGDGCYMRQPLYAGDFSKIIMSCIEKRITNQVFNISGLEKINYIDIILEIKKVLHSKTFIVKIPYYLFESLLKAWSFFDKNPPFTVDQLKALVAHDEFEIINWPEIFSVTPTPFAAAIENTFSDPIYSRVILEF